MNPLKIIFYLLHILFTKRIFCFNLNLIFVYTLYLWITFFSMTTDRRSTTDCRTQLLQEMRYQNYDMIRFASYRTACKLRYVQKKVYCKL